MFWRQLMDHSAGDRIHPAQSGVEPKLEPRARQKVGRPAASQQARKSDDLDLLIGKRLRERRILLAITQEDLAHRIQLSPQQLQKYEIGENRISAARLFKLSRILEVPITWFFAPVANLGEDSANPGASPALKASTVAGRV
jgi:ribosome-binding protein aMBF1 (putative translation factor)